MQTQTGWVNNGMHQYWSLVFEDRAIPWQPFSPGVEVFPLCTGDNGDLKAALMRNAPGAEVPEHVHQGYEFILVLAGAESDARATYKAGDFIANPPGSRHAVRTEQGNTVLIVWTAPIQFV